MAQQTAVEWLLDKLYDSNGDAWENASTHKIQISIDIGEYFDLLRKSKQMEKKQQENAWDAAFGEGIGTTMGSVDYDAKFINWYTENYGANSNKQKLYSEEDVKFIATRFAHECRRKHPVTNNETIILFNEWFKQHKNK